MTLHVRIITPKKVVYEQEVRSVTLPSTEGVITILPKHAPLFSVLKEGILYTKYQDKEDYFAIGGGYIETDGKNVTVLVARAYGQDEIDEKLVDEAMGEAQKILSQSKDSQEIANATTLLRKSMIDMKLLKRRKAPKSYTQ